MCLKARLNSMPVRACVHAPGEGTQGCIWRDTQHNTSTQVCHHRSVAVAGGTSGAGCIQKGHTSMCSGPGRSCAVVSTRISSLQTYRPPIQRPNVLPHLLLVSAKEVLRGAAALSRGVGENGVVLDAREPATACDADRKFSMALLVFARPHHRCRMATRVLTQPAISKINR